MRRCAIVAPDMGRAAKLPRQQRGRQGWLARHMDGWQAGGLVVLLAASAVFLAVPRAVEPRVVPQPLIDGQALSATMAQDDALARQAEGRVLDVDIRAVGRELRLYNSAAARGKLRELAVARRRVIRATQQALRRDEQQLLALRAYQMVRFLQELSAWQRTGVRSAELDQLGGEFLEQTRRNQWCRGASRQLLPDEPLLRVFYKKRWSDITGADGGPFALTLDEDRLRFAFFIRHPLLPRSLTTTDTVQDQLRVGAYRNRARLTTIDKLGARDPSYPVLLARGVVLYRMRRYGDATNAFREHLESSPDGPYALRAQNYFKAALDRTREGLF